MENNPRVTFIIVTRGFHVSVMPVEHVRADIVRYESVFRIGYFLKSQFKLLVETLDSGNIHAL